MSELKKALDSLLETTYQSENPSDYVLGMRQGLEAGFIDALKPEHMKHTEEVRGLIEEMTTMKYLMQAFHNDMNHSLEAVCMGCCKKPDIEKALKPFEKESSE